MITPKHSSQFAGCFAS